MSKLDSKYVDFGQMGFSAFSKMPEGTTVKYFLLPVPGAVVNVSKSLKSSCTRAKSKCEISSTVVYVQVTPNTLEKSHVLTAQIVK